MFERYTEKARRAVFFSRYEAARHGIPEIDTACLLLGVLREDRALMGRLLPAGSAGVSKLRADVENVFPKTGGVKISAASDLPLSPAAKRAMAHAGQETELWHHRWIEPRHLLWGLLKEGGPETAWLKSHGLDLEKLALDLAQPAAKPGPVDRAALHRKLDAIPEGRLDAAATLLEGLAAAKFEVSGGGPGEPFQFSFDDKTE